MDKGDVDRDQDSQIDGLRDALHRHELGCEKRHASLDKRLSGVEGELRSFKRCMAWCGGTLIAVVSSSTGALFLDRVLG